MDDELSANQKLDIVLTFLNKTYYNAKLSNPIDAVTPVNEGSKSIIGKKRLSLENISGLIVLDSVVDFKPEVGEIDLIVEYLFTKGYIDKVEGEYGICYEGMILIENGGFEANARFAQRENERQIRRDRLLVVGSWMAGLGAILVVLIELIKHLGWVLSVNFLTDIFVYSLGICTGLLALSIALQVSCRKSKE